LNGGRQAEALETSILNMDAAIRSTRVTAAGNTEYAAGLSTQHERPHRRI